MTWSGYQNKILRSDEAFITLSYKAIHTQKWLQRFHRTHHEIRCRGTIAPCRLEPYPTDPAIIKIRGVTIDEMVGDFNPPGKISVNVVWLIPQIAFEKPIDTDCFITLLCSDPQAATIFKLSLG